MHLYEKKTVFPWKGLVITLAVFLAVIALFSVLTARASSSGIEEQKQLLERALRGAAVTSYAVSGSYPATLEALVQEYGVIIDEDRFIVLYDVFAPNVMPSITIIVRDLAQGEGGEVMIDDL